MRARPVTPPVIPGQSNGSSISDRMHALTLSGISGLGVLGLSQQIKSDQRSTLTALNLRNAINDTTRNIIDAIGKA